MEKSNTLKNAADVFMRESISERYSYNFEWLGRPIIQYPQDICALQELIWTVKPDLIIETGIAHGGSLIFSASMLALLEMSEAVLNGEMLDPSKPKRKVLGVDIDIRAHNRKAIEAHPMYPRIEMLEGSSISDEIFSKVKKVTANYSKILVVLDSNHTHDHVLSELKLYAPLVSVESYCVVFDTVVEDLSNDAFPDRPWGVGDNPKTAVWEYLKTHPEFEIDQAISDKILISVAPDGYLKRTAS
ncbi:cephalosporin hydroxylase family protein [Thalassospira profundimaris]|uniref:cephalosporin hydroxylase family protein n=1 Tax=Thalassospira profundimaris TaxID=502049 RepID=UPI0002873159|nr:cephalosporin hydroxylase family protein [Thalassospira profundimaris]EKF07897.1 cephalosporin hydroxylase [Thalassospira profundimaris WP0211]